jgi:MoaA/NifB/PqqE/SkfB family radical SAM enzyme
MTATVEIQQFKLWDKFKDKHVPLSFDLEVTARCNCDCRHCYINLAPNDLAARSCEFSVTEIGDIAEQAVGLGALWCLVTGGEPLLRPDFGEIYLALKRKGLLVSVFTNVTHQGLLPLRPAASSALRRQSRAQLRGHRGAAHTRRDRRARAW